MRTPAMRESGFCAVSNRNNGIATRPPRTAPCEIPPCHSEYPARYVRVRNSFAAVLFVTRMFAAS